MYLLQFAFCLSDESMMISSGKQTGTSSINNFKTIYFSTLYFTQLQEHTISTPNPSSKFGRGITETKKEKQKI